MVPLFPRRYVCRFWSIIFSLQSHGTKPHTKCPNLLCMVYPCHFKLDTFQLTLKFDAYFLKVSACLSSYFELRPCRPRLEKLKHLLAECPYRGPEYEEERGLGEDATEGEEGEQPKRRDIPKRVSDQVLIPHEHFVTC